MKFRLVLLVAAAALVAVACGDSSQALATVNGVEITADFMASLRAGSDQTLNIDSEEFRNELSQNIIRVAIVQSAADEFQLEATEAEIAERIANPPPRWQALFAGLADDPNSTDVLAEAQAELSILRDEVVAELIRAEPGFVEATINETPQEIAAGCVRHILVDSELEAQAALDRLNAGEDFEQLASEITTDEVTGGGLVGGCPVGFAGFVPPFAFAAATAPLNEVVGPVQSEFGFHLIRVEQRVGPPSLDELMDDPVRFYPGVTLSSFFTPWFNGVVRDADISVAATVGRWSEAGIGIIPPGQ